MSAKGEEPAAHEPVVEQAETAELAASAHLVQAWDRMRLAIKRDTSGVIGHPNFLELEAGKTDYDACFRDWWFKGIVRMGNRWMFKTSARDEAITLLGLNKYRHRIEHAIRAYIPIPKTAEIHFTVVRHDAATA